MRHRHLPLLLLAVAFFSGASGLRAVVPVYTWIGGGTPGDTSDTINWQGGSVPDGSGSQNEDIVFGVATGSAQTITVPSSGIVLHDFTFSGASRPDYTFNGTGSLVITGNVTADAGGTSCLTIR